MNEGEGERGTMLYFELMSHLKRYSEESDISVYEILGALEAAKTQMLDSLRASNRAKHAE